MKHFVRTFSIMRALGILLWKRFEMEEVRNYGKIACIKNIFENGWLHAPHLTSCIRLWPYATETIKRVWHIHISITWYH